ncbi:hypothetical protein [Methylobacterium sp. J-092]|uniref:hypothetical protein n=1 Tax=Methylobacterium sp. J-092 TaxID=2836667 RepID=UPI001FB8815E|nr:hypothetical protein [Methylobacterium sp. J-092]MCJ2009182.1 hypothetical protein [Methylobacterium sp. J-092]
MSDQPQPARTISLAEMNGRIEEIERQRDGAQKQLAILAGERALLLAGLTEARAEIARLTAVLSEAVISA